VKGRRSGGGGGNQEGEREEVWEIRRQGAVRAARRRPESDLRAAALRHYSEQYSSLRGSRRGGGA
jgi:hypothetical protein